jgi:hypothetical protein
MLAVADGGSLRKTMLPPGPRRPLTAWPAAELRPRASNLTGSAGQGVPNLVVVEAGLGGLVSLPTQPGPAHVVADIVGWFGEPVTPPP